MGVTLDRPADADTDRDQAGLYASSRIIGQYAAPTPDDLAIINARFSAEPLAPDQVFVFDAIASTDAVDSYFTHQDIGTSLRNYVEDFTVGQALLDSHNARRMPMGSSFRAVMEPITEAEGVPATMAVRVGYFMLRGHDVPGSGNTDDYIRGIQAGIYRRMSISFGGNTCRLVCDIDGSDLWDWDSPFWPGQELKDGTFVTYTVMDARALETSIVYKNATPGALIQRVAGMVERGTIPDAERRRLEQRWGVRFEPPARQYRGAVGGAQRKERRMDSAQVRALLTGAKERAGATISAATREKIDTALQRLDDAGGGIDDAVTALSALIGDAADSAASGRAIIDALGDDATPEAVARIRAAAAEAERLRGENGTLADRIGKLEGDAQTARFEKVCANWVGDRKQHVKDLRHIASLFGEESPQFAEHVRINKGNAERTGFERRIGGPIDREVGSGQRGEGATAQDQLEAMAKERQQKEPGLSYEQAYARVAKENPSLANEANAATRHHA